MSRGTVAIQSERRWLSLHQVAERMGVSLRTVERWIAAARNPLPSRRLRGLRRVELTALESWVDRVSRP